MSETVIDTHALFVERKPVGYYEIGGPQGIQVGIPRRPNWLHRTMVRLVFGFIWKDGWVS